MAIQYMENIKAYINSNKVDLGVTVLASLGGRHINYLARAT
jgi:hypothetical protein